MSTPVTGARLCPLGLFSHIGPASLPLELGVGRGFIQSQELLNPVSPREPFSEINVNQEHLQLLPCQQKKQLFLPSTVTAGCCHGNIIAFLLDVE